VRIPGSRSARNVRFPRGGVGDGRSGRGGVRRRPSDDGRLGRAGGRGRVHAERPEHRVAVHVHQERLRGHRAVRGQERDRH